MLIMFIYVYDVLSSSSMHIQQIEYFAKVKWKGNNASLLRRKWPFIKILEASSEKHDGKISWFSNTAK